MVGDDNDDDGDDDENPGVNGGSSRATSVESKLGPATPQDPRAPEKTYARLSPRTPQLPTEPVGRPISPSAALPQQPCIVACPPPPPLLPPGCWPSIARSVVHGSSSLPLKRKKMTGRLDRLSARDGRGRIISIGCAGRIHGCPTAN